MNTRIASIFFGLVLLLASSSPFAAELVNINRSDAAGIQQSLIGIGPVKAEAIVAYRKKNGAFKSIDDLQNVSGIGPGLIKKNKRYLSLKKGVVSGDAAKYKSAKKQAKAKKSTSSTKTSAKKKTSSSSSTKKSTSKSTSKAGSKTTSKNSKSAAKSGKSAKVKCKGSNKLVASKADCKKVKKKTTSKSSSKSKSKAKKKTTKKAGTT